ncbi:hypothetical protein J6590_032336 [Homalodisca vitripennis]|nr:hypothetical protein J6590_032336 [Homalodisca vitripennis]
MERSNSHTVQKVTLILVKSRNQLELTRGSIKLAAATARHSDRKPYFFCRNFITELTKGASLNLPKICFSLGLLVPSWNPPTHYFCGYVVDLCCVPIPNRHGICRLSRTLSTGTKGATRQTRVEATAQDRKLHYSLLGINTYHLNPTTPSGKGGSSRFVPPSIRDAALAPPGISTPSGFDVTAGGAYSVHGRDPVTKLAPPSIGSATQADTFLRDLM